MLLQGAAGHKQKQAAPAPAGLHRQNRRVRVRAWTCAVNTAGTAAAAGAATACGGTAHARCVWQKAECSLEEEGAGATGCAPHRKAGAEARGEAVWKGCRHVPRGSLKRRERQKNAPGGLCRSRIPGRGRIWPGTVRRVWQNVWPGVAGRRLRAGMRCLDLAVPARRVLPTAL